jgi:hypothetical protein
VISPLLANIYLHWFEKAFYGPQGPATWAQARMVRYADDFVILAKQITPRLIEWVEAQLEGRFRLTINRSKTRTVDLNQPSASLDFLGYTFRFDRDLFGRGGRYLNVLPSKRSLARFRDRMRELTVSSRGLVPVDDLVRDVTRYLAGWGRYFAYGYPRRVFNRADAFVLGRLVHHLQRRSRDLSVRRMESRSWPTCNARGCSYWNPPWDNAARTPVLVACLNAAWGPQPKRCLENWRSALYWRVIKNLQGAERHAYRHTVCSEVRGLYCSNAELRGSPDPQGVFAVGR